MDPPGGAPVGRDPNRAWGAGAGLRRWAQTAAPLEKEGFRHGCPRHTIEHDEAGFGVDQEFEPSNRDTFRLGWGNGLRYRFTDFLLAKAAFELATRLPTADEVFGDNAFVLPNIELVPESSHNFNARSQGIEAAAGWTSPREYLAIDGNVTYQDFRNVSTEGRFSPFEGDRFPNTRYFFANGSVRFQLSELMAPGDQLSLSWYAGSAPTLPQIWRSNARLPVVHEEHPGMSWFDVHEARTKSALTRSGAICGQMRGGRVCH